MPTLTKLRCERADSERVIFRTISNQVVAYQCFFATCRQAWKQRFVLQYAGWRPASWRPNVVPSVKDENERYVKVHELDWQWHENVGQAFGFRTFTVKCVMWPVNTKCFYCRFWKISLLSPEIPPQASVKTWKFKFPWGIISILNFCLMEKTHLVKQRSNSNF